jgi:CheY-like chemotaxis protein
MISSSESSAYAAEAKEAGIDKVLQKPLFPSTIADIILDYLGLAAPQQEEAGIDISGAFKGRSILIAEDLEVNREIIQALLAPTEIETNFAFNGLEAVRMFGRGPGKYELILMDVQMPEMDGYEAARRIRSLSVPDAGSVPIIAMTANVFKEDVEKCLAAGMNGHVGKPLDAGELFGKLYQYLGAEREEA